MFLDYILLKTGPDKPNYKIRKQKQTNKLCLLNSLNALKN